MVDFGISNLDRADRRIMKEEPGRDHAIFNTEIADRRKFARRGRTRQLICRSRRLRTPGVSTAMPRGACNSTAGIAGSFIWIVTTDGSPTGSGACPYAASIADRAARTAPRESHTGRITRRTSRAFSRSKSRCARNTTPGESRNRPSSITCARIRLTERRIDIAIRESAKNQDRGNAVNRADADQRDHSI